MDTQKDKATELAENINYILRAEYGIQNDALEDKLFSLIVKAVNEYDSLREQLAQQTATLANAHSRIATLAQNNDALLEACKSALRDIEARGDEDIHKYLLAELRQAINQATK